MSQVQRGFYGSLDKYISFKEPITVKLVCEGENVYDFACFGVNSRNRLTDEGYMVFYNQKASTYKEISVNLLRGMALFNIDLNKLPDSVHKLVFSVSIDGNGRMKDVRDYKVILMQRDKELLTASYSGGDIFSDEKSSIYLELVRAQSWDISLICQGFAGDLGELVRYFGEEVKEEGGKAKPTEAPLAVDLSGNDVSSAKRADIKPSAEAAAKRSVSGAGNVNKTEAVFIPYNYTQAELGGCKDALLNSLPQTAELRSLAEPLAKALLKYGLKDRRAKLCLAVDGSGSMTVQWLNGFIQKIAELTVPAAAHFDDKRQFDIWFFAKDSLRGGTVNASNYKESVPQVGSKTAGGLDYFALIKQIGSFNNEENIVKALSEAYGAERGPVFIVFVSGGGVKESERLSALLKQSADMPIFWKFIGLDKNKDYGVLAKTEEFDNTDFFRADNIADSDREEFYDSLLRGFNVWLGRKQY